MALTDLHHRFEHKNWGDEHLVKLHNKIKATLLSNLVSLANTKPSSPSSGSSLAQVSAVMRLAMKRWLFWGLMQRWGATDEVMDMEDVMWGHVMTEPLEEDEEEEEEDEEEEVGSRVVAKCSFSGSTSMESRRT